MMEWMPPGISKASSDSSSDDGLHQGLERENTPSSFSIPSWNPSNAIISLLDYHLECGDVQLCVAIGLVLGKRVELPYLNEWKMAYSNLLRRFGMYIEATELQLDVFIW